MGERRMVRVKTMIRDDELDKEGRASGDQRGGVHAYSPTDELPMRSSLRLGGGGAAPAGPACEEEDAMTADWTGASVDVEAGQVRS
jgi:hypothetical protein